METDNRATLFEWAYFADEARNVTFEDPDEDISRLFANYMGYNASDPAQFGMDAKDRSLAADGRGQGKRVAGRRYR